MYNNEMTGKIQRVYIDSSVVSGMFDSNDHPVKVKPFWDAVFNGKIRVILSSILDDELESAPQHIRDFYKSIPESQIERGVSTEESNRLAALYIAAGIVSPKHIIDCRHVALAAVTCADVLVSFNCRHIVNFNRIDRYNAINTVLGYHKIKILTPDKLTYKETNHDKIRPVPN